MCYRRTTKTASGATAVQVAQYQKRQNGKIRNNIRILAAFLCTPVEMYARSDRTSIPFDLLVTSWLDFVCKSGNDLSEDIVYLQINLAI